MASTLEYAEFVCEKLRPFGNVRCRKMFGEYMVYLNDKPVLSVCDNAVFVKKLPELDALMRGCECGCPYEGAKEHYMPDIDDAALLSELIPMLEKFTPLPKPKKSKGKA